MMRPQLNLIPETLPGQSHLPCPPHQSSSSGKRAVSGNVSYNSNVSYNNSVAQQPYDLFALLAHQLRTYMTYIGVAAEGLYSGYSHFSSQQEGLQFICEQVEHATEVLERGLKLVRLLREESLPLEPIALSLLVQPVIDRLQDQHGRREITVSLPENDRVVGNRLLVELILENLLQNALIHAGAAASVWITAEEQDEMIVVSVTDNGRGIAEERLQNLFLPSEQASSAGATKSSRGLGLFLTKVAVETLGGQIGVESQLSAGSCFYFSLRKYSD